MTLHGASPYFEAPVRWAGTHRWSAGQTLEGASSNPTLWLIREGEVHLRSGETEWILPAGTAFLMASAWPRVIRTPTGAQWDSVTLFVNLFRRVDAMAALPLPLRWEPIETERRLMASCMTQIAAVWQRPDPGSRLICDAAANLLFGLCWQACGCPDLLTGHGRETEWVTRTLRHLKQQPQTSVAEWARAAGFSDAQFRRRFRAWFQTSPLEFLVQRRLQQAAERIRSSDVSIAVVAEELGFYNHSHFTRVFKKAFGLPPSQYRAAAGEPLI